MIPKRMIRENTTAEGEGQRATSYVHRTPRRTRVSPPHMVVEVHHLCRSTQVIGASKQAGRS